MRARGFTEKTPNDYIRNARAFGDFIGRSPDRPTAEDLRRFQLHQTQSGMQWAERQQAPAPPCASSSP